jgi:hypothetical protein
MKTRRPLFVVAMVGGMATLAPGEARAQNCLSELFSCCRKAPPAYAVAPVPAPIIAPVAAPVPAPPPPVVVPVQQVSYVPETTYRTQYKSVPVTSYKPSCEIDPCTGCPRECMEQVTQYVQQAVNVPVTQYRAVYSTKYVQMQPGYNAAGAYAAPAPAGVQMVPGAQAAPMMVPATSGAVQSPFAASVQTTPQAWGAAGADVPQQMIQPGQQSLAAPQLQPGTMVQPGFQQQIVPQSGTYAAPAPAAVQPQPTAPPMLSPTPSLRPIPEMPRASAANGTGVAVPQLPQSAPAAGVPATVPQPRLESTPPQSPAAPQTSGSTGATGVNGMPVMPGVGPGAATGAFPKLLEPTGHTTSWQPTPGYRPTAYPTAALPGRIQ